MNNKLISSKWIAKKKYLNVFRSRPNYRVKDLALDILQRYASEVNKNRLYKAKAIAVELLRGSTEEHYGLLKSYIAELRRVDKEGRFDLLLGKGDVFKGMYMGFSSLVNGFKMSCRPLIALDGCFLKTFLSRLHTISKVHGRICPNIIEKIEKLFDSREYTAHPALGWKFEVHFEDDKCVVNLGDRTCTCRVWDLTRIPCVHGVACIRFKNEDATTFIDDYYTVSRYLEGYRVGLEPIRGQRMWPEVEETTVKPPVIRRMSGRPKKKRRRAPEEKDPKFPKKKRSGVQMTCQNCHQQGHNSRSGKLHLRISYAPYIYFSLEYQQANG
ncbi:uncharacterized protein LOC121786923 [Salvia splendens]|uniref:uncharacterized protein LOC121786923 n=1 Tax=Salvia splendens TaxID=180675 RepID=UPI001C27692F|nr:uncharacterized protein LOC121786923 [Salvia splendens]